MITWRPRTSLVGTIAAALFVSGCAASVPSAEQPKAPPLSSDDQLRTKLATSEQLLIDQYVRLLAAKPRLGNELGPWLEHHRAHLEVLRDGDRLTASPAPRTSKAAATPLRPSDIALAEKAHANLVAQAVESAEAPDLIRLLTAIGASEAQHVALGKAPGPAIVESVERATLPTSQDTAAAAALDGEHAVIWAYGIATAGLGDGRHADGIKGLVRHKQLRNTLRADLVKHGAKPHGPEAAYALPFPLGTPARSRRLLAYVEARSAALLADLVAMSPVDRRRPFLRAVNDAAIASTSWGSQPEAFPAHHESTMDSTSPSADTTASGSPTVGPS